MKDGVKLRTCCSTETAGYFLLDFDGADTPLGGVVVVRHIWVEEEFECMFAMLEKTFSQRLAFLDLERRTYKVVKPFLYLLAMFSFEGGILLL